jgi:Tfp pilus assembly protein PilN
MRQEVNLYGPHLLGQGTRVSASHIGLAVVLLVAVLAAFGGWQEWRLAEARSAANALQAELTELNKELERRAATLSARAPADALLRQVERLERERAGKQALLGRLEGEAMGNQRGFSAHLEGLGRQHPEGLWLRRVYLGAGGRRLGLEGGVTDAELLPRYLNALSGEPAFAGTQFDSFSLRRPERPGSHLSFTLATPCHDESGRRLSSEACAPEAWPGGRQ